MERRASPALVSSILSAILALGCRPSTEPRLVRTGEGAPIGTLRKVDAFPLYELRMEAAYDLEDLRVGAAGTAAAVPAAAGAPRAAFACTCFSACAGNGKRVFGRNFDWAVNPALLLLTEPASGYASVSMVDISYLGYATASDPFAAPEALAAAWRIPFDGMNERGLAVGMMAISRADGISGEGRPRVGELGIMRILLDGAANVDEGLALMGEYDIDLGDPPIHYFLADRGGRAAVVEYLDGKSIVYRNEAPWMVSTNFLFSDVPLERRTAACERFALANSRLEAGGGELGTGGAFALLEAVSQPSTRWSAVYGLAEGSVAVALGRNFRSPYRWSLAASR